MIAPYIPYHGPMMLLRIWSCQYHYKTDKALFFLPGTDLNAPGLQSSNCSTPGYVSYNIGDGTCYKYFDQQVPQYEAETRCLQDNARLIAVNSSDDITIVKALVG